MSSGGIGGCSGRSETGNNIILTVGLIILSAFDYFLIMIQGYYNYLDR